MTSLMRPERKGDFASRPSPSSPDPFFTGFKGDADGFCVASPAGFASPVASPAEPRDLLDSLDVGDAGDAGDAKSRAFGDAVASISIVRVLVCGSRLKSTMISIVRRDGANRLSWPESARGFLGHRLDLVSFSSATLPS